MSNIPITRTPVPQAKSAAIRAAVAAATSLPSDNESSQLATLADAALFHDFLSDPQIHAPIYTLPRPLTVESVRAFIADHQQQRERGCGLLFLNFDDQGRIGGYSDICIWPEWAAGELGGALHPDRQGERRGVEGARQSFAWIASQRADGTARPSLVWEISRAQWREKHRH